MTDPIVRQADHTVSYTIPSFYLDYKQGIEADSVYDVDYPKYRAIVTDYFKYLRDRLIEESRRVRLPYRMGIVQIIKHRPKHWDSRSLRIDYKASKDLGKVVYLDNMHSDFYKMRLYWSKLDMIARNQSKYQIVLTRANKRRLAQCIKQKLHDYEEL